jgi:hypothetical protein
MFNPKRLWMVLSSALTLGVAGVLVLAATAPGSSALRAVANNLTVAAHAAGGGGGGVVTITVAPTAALTAKLAATVSVSYTCPAIFNPSTGLTETQLASNVYIQVVQRQGKVVAHGSGFSSGMATCDGNFVNHASAVVVPDIYPGFVSPPLKRGTALATASVYACSTAVISGPFGACDFGSAGPLTISIK